MLHVLPSNITNEMVKQTANKIAKEAANEKLDELVKKSLSIAA